MADLLRPALVRYPTFTKSVGQWKFFHPKACTEEVAMKKLLPKSDQKYLLFEHFGKTLDLLLGKANVLDVFGPLRAPVDHLKIQGQIKTMKTPSVFDTCFEA